MKRTIGLISIIVVVLIAGYVDVTLVSEAYGSGPPHYSRTANMDKWSNPLPALTAVNVITLGALFLVWRTLLSTKPI